MLTRQQRRLRREDYNGDSYVPFSERTCNDGEIKIEFYGTLQDLYDIEYNAENYID